MSNITPLQWMTLLFGTAVIVTSIVQFNGPSMSNTWQQLVDTLSASLGFFFVAFTWFASTDRNVRSAKMAKWFIILLSIAAWVIVGLNNASISAGWQNVQTEVATPLAVASPFALGLAFFSFPIGA